MLELLSETAQQGLAQDISEIINQKATLIAAENSKALLNQQEAAKYLDVSLSYFKSTLMPAGIPTVTFPNVTRYRRQDLDQFIKRYLKER